MQSAARHGPQRAARPACCQPASSLPTAPRSRVRAALTYAVRSLKAMPSTLAFSTFCSQHAYKAYSNLRLIRRVVAGADVRATSTTVASAVATAPSITRFMFNPNAPVFIAAAPAPFSNAYAGVSSWRPQCVAACCCVCELPLEMSWDGLWCCLACTRALSARAQPLAQGIYRDHEQHNHHVCSQLRTSSDAVLQSQPPSRRPRQP